MKIATVLLASIVQDVTIEDHIKLLRLLCCLVDTLDLTTFLGAENSHALVTPEDVSYAPHDDFKSRASSTSSHGARIIL